MPFHTKHQQEVIIKLTYNICSLLWHKITLIFYAKLHCFGNAKTNPNYGNIMTYYYK